MDLKLFMRQARVPVLPFQFNLNIYNQSNPRQTLAWVLSCKIHAEVANISNLKRISISSGCYKDILDFISGKYIGIFYLIGYFYNCCSDATIKKYYTINTRYSMYKNVNLYVNVASNNFIKIIYISPFLSLYTFNY